MCTVVPPTENCVKGKVFKLLCWTLKVPRKFACGKSDDSNTDGGITCISSIKLFPR